MEADEKRLATLHTEGYNRLRIERIVIDKEMLTIRFTASHSYRSGDALTWDTPLQTAHYNSESLLWTEQLKRIGWDVRPFGKGKVVESGLNATFGKSIPPPAPSARGSSPGKPSPSR
ncbi:MAG: hypothetical protein ABIO72_02175 [Patescibacteria group bacterium]